MKHHIQTMLSDRAVEITLNNGKYIREIIESVDLIGVVVSSYTTSGMMTKRVIPWSTIQDIATLSEEDLAEDIDEEDMRWQHHGIENYPLGYADHWVHGVFDEWTGDRVGTLKMKDALNCSVCQKIFVNNKK
jgi:hypothetical protein